MLGFRKTSLLSSMHLTTLHHDDWSILNQKTPIQLVSKLAPNFCSLRNIACFSALLNPVFNNFKFLLLN